MHLPNGSAKRLRARATPFFFFVFYISRMNTSTYPNVMDGLYWRFGMDTDGMGKEHGHTKRSKIHEKGTLICQGMFGARSNGGKGGLWFFTFGIQGR